MFSFSPQFYSCCCSSWESLTSLIKALERGLLLLPKEILIVGVVPLLLRSGVHPCSTPSLPAANGKWTLNPSRVTGSGNGWGWKQRCLRLFLRCWGSPVSRGVCEEPGWHSQVTAVRERQEQPV